MKSRSRPMLVGLACVFGLLALGAYVYEYEYGFPRYIDGHWVYRHTDWHGVGFGVPLIRYRGATYYYTDTQGQEVEHGPYQRVHKNGMVEMLGTYSHGKHDGTWTEWDEDGVLRKEERWDNGRYLGMKSYGKVVEHHPVRGPQDDVFHDVP